MPLCCPSQVCNKESSVGWEDLEGVPEEEEEEVIEPFVRIDDETIQHFSHDHHYLKIYGNHVNNFCQACILPLTASDRFYSCIQCEFVLHETCASLPRKNYHPLHKHPLTLLHPASPNYPSQGFFRCRACYERCCGFMFECSDKNCGFQLDAICGSVSDPSIHDFHPRDHPLFFSLDRGKCMRCSSRYCSGKYLECIKCKSFLGLSCATLPSLAHYKHDKHPLTLCYGEEDKTTDLQYWCEICEAKLDAREWFYTCNSCTVTLHIACLLGKTIYEAKPCHQSRK